MKPVPPGLDAGKRRNAASTSLRSADMPEGDSRWMKLALTLARKAVTIGETPVGAVVVRNGTVLGRGYNRRECFSDVTQHAELMAIRQAERRLGTWRLDGCDLYVTLEPCIMCAGAIVQARIENVYYAASDPKAGAAGSIVDVFAIRQNHQTYVAGGLMADEGASLLKLFFQERRQQNKTLGTRAERRTTRISQKMNREQGNQES